jgi:transposase
MRQPDRHPRTHALGRTPRNWAEEIPARHTTRASNEPTQGQNKTNKRVGFGFRTFRNDRSRVPLHARGVKCDLLATLTPP